MQKKVVNGRSFLPGLLHGWIMAINKVGTVNSISCITHSKSIKVISETFNPDVIYAKHNGLQARALTLLSRGEIEKKRNNFFLDGSAKKMCFNKQKSKVVWYFDLLLKNCQSLWFHLKFAWPMSEFQYTFISKLPNPEENMTSIPNENIPIRR